MGVSHRAASIGCAQNTLGSEVRCSQDVGSNTGREYPLICDMSCGQDIRPYVGRQDALGSDVRPSDLPTGDGSRDYTPHAQLAADYGEVSYVCRTSLFNEPIARYCVENHHILCGQGHLPSNIPSNVVHYYLAQACLIWSTVSSIPSIPSVAVMDRPTFCTKLSSPSGGLVVTFPAVVLTYSA